MRKIPSSFYRKTLILASGVFWLIFFLQPDKWELPAVAMFGLIPAFIGIVVTLALSSDYYMRFTIATIILLILSSTIGFFTSINTDSEGKAFTWLYSFAPAPAFFVGVIGGLLINRLYKLGRTWTSIT